MICNVEWQHIEGNYPVITLCESTRFKEEFMMAQKRLTLEGHIVISVGLFGHSGDEKVWDVWMKVLYPRLRKCWMICTSGKLTWLMRYL